LTDKHVNSYNIEKGVMILNAVSVVLLVQCCAYHFMYVYNGLCVT